MTEKVTFEYQFNHLGDHKVVRKNVLDFDALFLPDILGAFEEFLSDAGFSFEGKHLKFVKDIKENGPENDGEIVVGCYVQSKGETTALLRADCVYEVKGIVDDDGVECVLLTVYDRSNKPYDFTYPMEWFKRVL